MNGETVCPGCPKGWCKGCVPVILTDEDKVEMRKEIEKKRKDKNAN